MGKNIVLEIRKGGYVLCERNFIIHMVLLVTKVVFTIYDRLNMSI